MICNPDKHLFFVLKIQLVCLQFLQHTYFPITIISLHHTFYPLYLNVEATQ